MGKMMVWDRLVQTSATYLKNRRSITIIIIIIIIMVIFKCYFSGELIALS